ncbi:golgin subfamily A member 6-like protein 22 [Astyanax mexicanus]|uniref:golgin subfamily A member 6-like protein 22 n=1 Tax=Astyanax mexicanus TaxID=7994 RepID=UPI0020CB0DD4|nr:golgin subfamily A member 6-like protein 22 [Astyanax mexicanus]
MNLCVPTGSKDAVLVVLHHTFDPELVVPDSSRSVNRENTLTVDCLFHEGRGLLQCYRNQEALEKVIRWVKIQNVPQTAHANRFRRPHGPTANPTDTQIKQPKHQLQGKDEILQQHQHELQRRDEVIRQLEHELQKKEHELQRKDKVLQQQQQELQRKEKELQRKDKVLQQQQQELQRKDQKKVFGMVIKKIRPITKHDSRNQRQLKENQVEDPRELLTEAEKLKITDKEITQKPDMAEKMFNRDSRNSIRETEKRDRGASKLYKKSKFKQENEERRNPDESKSLKQQIVQTEKKDKRTPPPEIKGLFSGNPPDLSQAGASIPTQKHETRRSFKETGAVQKRSLHQFRSMP